MGYTELVLIPISVQEKNNNIMMRKSDTEVMSSGPIMAALTLFQLLTFLQLWMAKGDEHTMSLVTAFGGLIVIEWLYFAMVRISRRAAFEMEIIAFFLSTLSLAVVASKSPEDLVNR